MKISYSIIILPYPLTVRDRDINTGVFSLPDCFSADFACRNAICCEFGALGPGAKRLNSEQGSGGRQPPGGLTARPPSPKRRVDLNHPL